MRYICICCEASGADSGGYTSTVGPYHFNCHVCRKHGTMWPLAQAEKYLRTVKAFQEPRGDNEADRRTISMLQESLNELKSALALAVEHRDATIELGLKIVDQILPQAGSITIDVGAVNEFCIRARK